jgi:hypothetical protein
MGNFITNKEDPYVAGESQPASVAMLAILLLVLSGGLVASAGVLFEWDGFDRSWGTSWSGHDTTVTSIYVTSWLTGIGFLLFNFVAMLLIGIAYYLSMRVAKKSSRSGNGVSTFMAVAALVLIAAELGLSIWDIVVYYATYTLVPDIEFVTVAKILVWIIFSTAIVGVLLCIYFVALFARSKQPTVGEAKELLTEAKSKKRSSSSSSKSKKSSSKSSKNAAKGFSELLQD